MGWIRAHLKALSQVQHEVPAMNPALIESILNAELGAGMGSIASWDPVPIATASIGQVHRGVLTDGRAVAIKVQYQGLPKQSGRPSNAELLTTFLKTGGIRNLGEDRYRCYRISDVCSDP